MAKKIVGFCLVAVIIAFTATLYAQSTTSKTTSTEKKTCYVDANNNNVCDKYESHACKGGNGTGAPDCKKNQATKTSTTKTSAKKTTK